MKKAEAISVLATSVRPREAKDRARYDEAVKMAIEALEQPERTEERMETHACDSIDRQAAIDECYPITVDGEVYEVVQIETLMGLPSAQPEIKPIDYQDCANAMLRMWMDEVVTDGEYNRIMDKLNAFWRTRNDRSD